MHWDGAGVHHILHWSEQPRPSLSSDSGFALQPSGALKLSNRNQQALGVGFLHPWICWISGPGH